nr:hypothetical protein [Rickettsiales endosymbiont of Trichoplax sp. H2]
MPKMTPKLVLRPIVLPYNNVLLHIIKKDGPGCINAIIYNKIVLIDIKI